jgi:YbbR domain-containing protein
LDALATNIKTIVLALVISVITWFAISFQLFPDVIMNVEKVPVTATPSDYADMIENNLELSGEFNAMVTARIQGKRYDVVKPRPEDFIAYLDLSDVKEPGEHTVKVVVEPVADGVKYDILNDNITKKINVIQTAEITLDVIPVADDIAVIEGMQIDYDNLDVYPRTVRLSGEKSLIDKVERAVAKAVYAEVLPATADDINGELVLYDKNDKIVSHTDIYVNNRDFKVRVPVFKQRTIPVKVQIDAPSNFNLDSLLSRLRVDPEELTISAPDSSIDYYDNIVELSLNELTLADLQGGVVKEFELPPAYTNMTGKNYALLTFDDVDDYGSMVFEVEVSDENFSTRNPQPGYEVKYITRQISVKVAGPSSVVHSMSAADFRATVDLLGIELSEGTRAIGVNFRIAGTDAEAWVVGEYKINIETVKIEKEE